MRLISRPISSILVLKFGGIGDVVTMVPALKALRRAYPAARISLLAESPSREVIEGAPWYDELITFTKLYRSRNLLKVLFNRELRKQAYQLLKFLTRRRFDLFIEFHQLFNLRDTLKPLVLGGLARASFRAGLDTDRRGYFLNIKVPDARFAEEHMVNRCARIVEALGVPVPDRQTEIWVTEDDRRFARRFLEEHGIPINRDDLVIGLHPGGNPDYLIRCSWPEERFAQVADILSEKYGAKILLTGSAREVDYVRQVAARLKTKPIIAAGLATVKQSAALMECCRLFISNDTGPMHIAVAMKTPTIGIFGPGDWQMYGTYPPEAGFIMLRKPIDCWPCPDLQCTTRACLKLVTVEEVLAAADNLLHRQINTNKTNRTNNTN